MKPLSETPYEDLLFGKRTGKLLRGEEVKPPAKRNYRESSEQTTIAGYIKKHYPDIPIETVRHEGKKQYWQQNQDKKQNSADSFPDTRVYLPRITLMIENKPSGAKIIDKMGRLSTMHLQCQYMTHKRLFNEHTKVYFAIGVTEAIQLFEQCRNDNYPEMQVFKDNKEYAATSERNKGETQ